MLDESSPVSRLTVIPVPSSGPVDQPQDPVLVDRGRGGPAPEGRWSRETLQLAADGDGEAWRALVDAHADMLWQAIRDLGLAGSDAVTVWQHAWLSLAQRAEEAIRHGDVGRWLLVTAVGEACRLRLRSWVPFVPQTRRPSVTLVPSAGCDVGA
jgi:hypothetical protein